MPRRLQPVETPATVFHRCGPAWRVACETTPVGLRLRLWQGPAEVAVAALPRFTAGCRIRPLRGGLALAGRGRSGVCWALRLLADPEAADGLVVLERCRGSQSDWTLRFPGRTVHTHRQLALDARPAARAAFRLGAFTQHGQLFDLKDWFLVRRGNRCNGLLALRPGCWRAPHAGVVRVCGVPEGVVAHLPADAAGVLTRSLLLVSAPAVEALATRRCGIPYFETHAGHAAWPAQRIARHGFARPERVAASRRLAATACRSAPPFAFGRAADLDAALDRTSADPARAGGHPFWLGRFDASRRAALATLREACAALTDAGYLHPLGNPVACRSLAPAAATLHLLDALGRLGPAARRAAAADVGVLADLLSRRDFYPWHVAAIPAGEPGSVQGIYRGMLNQNFNTDRYAFVGLAGCLLPAHPRAGLWRRHAVAQFRAQMRAFVRPGGAWEESHTYADHVKLCLLPLALALRCAPEPVDLLADRRFAAMCRFFVPLLSPPDPLLGGARGIPAVGDHGYAVRHPYLFAWLAALRPVERNRYLWAWRQAGSGLTDPRSAQAGVFSPLLVAGLSDRATSRRPPRLPTRRVLPGYGAVARASPHTCDESLLVVRCGETWAHYHPDQGSFWWYGRGRLLCAEADLGNGELKFRHAGHNVLGYVDREPMQYLDRDPFRVTRLSGARGAPVTIRCQVPVSRWCVAPQRDRPIPAARQPGLTRTFRWYAPDRLDILDRPVRSPRRRVVWHLHVVAEAAAPGDGRTVHFHLGAGAGALRVRLPEVPLRLALAQAGRTIHLACTYREAPLRHRLEYHALP